MGSVQKKLGDLSQAKDYLDRALAIRLNKLGPERVDVVNSFNNLGSVHKNLGHLTQAKDYHDRALAVRLKELRLDHIRSQLLAITRGLCIIIWITCDRRFCDSAAYHP